MTEEPDSIVCFACGNNILIPASEKGKFILVECPYCGTENKA